MTDKQIIIDGIDVGGCIYYEDGKCLNGEIVQCNCKKVAVCYYKEYKRKEQECEELKRQHQADKGLITATGKMNYQLLQEYDKLKTAITEIREIVGVGLVDGLQPEEYSGFLKILQAQILQKISECEVVNDRNE